MAQNVADYIGRPQTVTAPNGEQWILSRWDRSIWTQLQEYAATKIPDPRKVAMEFLSIIPQSDGADRAHVVDVQLREANEYLSIRSPRMLSFADSFEGTFYVVYLLLKKNQPQITEDDAYDLVCFMGESIAEVLGKCRGTPPKKEQPPGSVPGVTPEQTPILAGPLSTAA